jgi:arylsulfatase A-like enzyme
VTGLSFRNCCHFGRPRHCRLAAALLALACSACERGGAVDSGKEGAASRPNILLVTFDTTRADRLSCYGYEPAKTPTIDALGDSGTRYTRCYAPAPITLPSHASLLTGLYPTHHQLRDNGVGRLDDKAETLSEVLQGVGYETAAVIGAFVLDARFGLNQGFDFYDDDIESSDRVTGLHFAERPGGAVTDSGIKWLDTVGEKPFFLWAHFFDPHSPYAPPGLPAGTPESQAYDAEITYADAQLGRLLDQIKKRDAVRGTQTLVVFTADHGESLH